MFPFVQFIFDKEPGVFRLLNGCQEEIKLHSPQRNTMGAIFNEILLQSIGGSEIFEKKQQFFFDQLLAHHDTSPHDREQILVRVQRSNLVDSVSISACLSYLALFLYCLVHGGYKKFFKQ